ncbi:MAG: sigma-70 family RNA polymerase sigma factor [Oscillospiraceae bacterium]|nr:sigma-70 family RNA polymerase sigma factor [Oscillospiraceae bacterium]
MTNEELVVKIKNGETGYNSELWQNVELFVCRQANSFYTKHYERCSLVGVETDDLIQAGYFAVVGAVKAYDGRYKFLTYLGRQLLIQFYELAKMRSTGWQNNTIYYAISLDAPIGVEGESTFVEFIPDLGAEAEISAIDEADYIERLREIFRRAGMKLTPTQANVIDGLYRRGLSFSQLANELGVSKGAIENTKSLALKKLRTPELLAYVSA